MPDVRVCVVKLSDEHGVEHRVPLAAYAVMDHCFRNELSLKPATKASTSKRAVDSLASSGRRMPPSTKRYIREAKTMATAVLTPP